MISLVTRHPHRVKRSYSTLNASQSHPKLDQVRTRTESRPLALEQRTRDQVNNPPQAPPNRPSLRQQSS